MHIYVNDEETPIESGETLDSLLSRLTSGGKLAVAVNDTVIRQAEWPDYQLQADDRVLLIAPVQGG
ncbi:sulfur carrier protein ThiS [Sedimenticola selenatireducens]|jgi:thiamine biosynthesis protein ThiS|uniref:Sulfur carrier protein ThiS n=2 Tax=Sedimenticola TaxID=349742 RepID=A0A558CKX0_9GAMM|nr:sulfur carrier protein ThiS [Sedimenticola selenatireducens]MCW8882051.1 sulfur carrier protein ThiS [Sedimenticola sp.]TVT49418.1 MAG: sulfur carrier protein ThiS [Sedimenticola thiotaurini]MDF1529733.1 sulfur carrier protein ThiS [Sedimenticola sp.]TVO75200.1 sulfur carrier protein ThiS [Sedimenticola selenatireducens]TVT66946.1 MAG: sulfur carrier protein ThiS [Sedimenticola selenatireducens]